MPADDGNRSLKLLASGGLAGAISRTVTAPIDRLKFLMQVSSTSRLTVHEVSMLQRRSGRSSMGTVMALNSTHVSGVVHVQEHAQAAACTLRSWRTCQGLAKMASERSLKAYFRGNGANVLKNVPETAIKLTCNDRVKALVLGDGRHVSGLSVGGCLSVCLPKPASPATHLS